MSKPLTVTNTILINATPTNVWNALVNPEQTKKYMFGCETVSDWKKGSSLVWRGMYEGKTMDFVTGIIADIVPGKFLAYTTIDPNSDIDNIPENHLLVTYELSDEKGQTLLTVTQGDYSKVANAEARYKEAYNNGEGWNPILVQIKALVETPNT
jgi:uncharacterized protein YndB with AHSA1/START domain